MNYVAFGCSVIGASHMRKGKVNQDSFYCTNNHSKSPIVVALADGHVGNKYIRSHIGSYFAVQTIATIVAQNTLLSLDANQQLEDLVDHIKSRFLLAWQQKIAAHILEEPLTEDEQAFLTENCGQDIFKQIIANPKGIYGCTFVCAIIYDGIWLLLQCGDGDILGLYNNEQVKVLTYEDPRNIANQTMSLGAITSYRDISHIILIGEGIPTLVALFTDGVKNSFDEKTAIDRFYKIPSLINSELKANSYSIEVVIEPIKKMLEQITENGSGDDVTIGIVASY